MIVFTYLIKYTHAGNPGRLACHAKDYDLMYKHLTSYKNNRLDTINIVFSNKTIIHLWPLTFSEVFCEQNPYTTT